MQHLAVVLMLLALESACSSVSTAPKGQQPVPPVPEAAASQAPPPPAPAGSTSPVYRTPRIGVVRLRAHEDLQGRLLGPQVMYQVVDPGGWNLDALEEGRGLAPAPVTSQPALGSELRLIDPDVAARTVITGLMRPEDRAAAEKMAERSAGGQTRAVFDEQAGWLLVPLRAEQAHP